MSARVAPTPNPDAPTTATRKEPLYPRLLRLHHLQPNAWQRAVFGEGSFLLAALLVMADVASAWTLAAVPLGVAAVVKFNDVLVGALPSTRPERPPPGDAAG